MPSLRVSRSFEKDTRAEKGKTLFAGVREISGILIVVGFALYGGIYFYASEPSVYGGLLRFGGLSVGARVLEVLGFVAGVFGLWLGLGYWMATAGPR